MTFLPIVERELRVAARKRSTFWVRILAALVALVVGSGFLFPAAIGFGWGTANLGKGLFAALTWLVLAATLSAGLFLTSNCAIDFPLQSAHHQPAPPVMAAV